MCIYIYIIYTFIYIYTYIYIYIYIYIHCISRLYNCGWISGSFHASRSALTRFFSCPSSDLPWPMTDHGSWHAGMPQNFL